MMDTNLMSPAEIYDLDDGWEAVRLCADGAGLDRLVLTRDSATVWEMEIPPKMPTEELVSQAQMYATIWERGYQAGEAEMRRALETFMRQWQ